MRCARVLCVPTHAFIQLVPRQEGFHTHEHAHTVPEWNARGGYIFILLYFEGEGGFFVKTNRSNCHGILRNTQAR